MDMKEILNRIGYVRNQANLSARELSFRIGMSSQYIAQVESGRIVLTVEKLLKILEVCHFPLERFFAANINEWDLNTKLYGLIDKLSAIKKQNMIEFIQDWIYAFKAQLIGVLSCWVRYALVREKWWQPKKPR